MDTFTVEQFENLPYTLDYLPILTSRVFNHQTSRSRITKPAGTFKAAEAAYSGDQVTCDM